MNLGNTKELNNSDLHDVLHTIFYKYGYDFTNYSTASIKRRILRCMELTKIKTVFDLKYELVNDPQFFPFFLQTITVNVTEMFRDPFFYKALATTVLPVLASYPIIKIWHAGCATGEEVFSMCILLHEHGLLDRCRIYATDINPSNLDKARKGIVPLSHMKEYTQNYLQAGGASDFSSYYSARYENALIRKEFRKNVLFSQHNLVTDHAFNEFHFVCCRNVLIYFNRQLQNRVINLFNDSMAPLAYLALGTKESLYFTDLRDKFEPVDSSVKIYRRKN